MGWVRACLKVLDGSGATFMRFMVVSGLRTGEAFDSFNLIIKLCREDRLHEYYNLDLEALEHFRYGRMFIRGSKNVFLSFIPKDLIKQIAKCNFMSYPKLKKRLKKHGLNMRLNELRDYFATFMVHHGLLREEVDLLQGRVGKSIFMRHYFSLSIHDLKERTFKGVRTILKELKG